MTNYPAGSMRGSGIYSSTIVMDLACESLDVDCKWYGNVDVIVNDSNIGEWTCPDCKAHHEVDLNEYNEPDPDEAYERMRDERDGWW